MNNKEQKFQTDIEYRLYRLRHFAKKYGWREIGTTKSFLLFDKGKDKSLTDLLVNIDPVRITSTVYHPKYGITKLLRKGDFTQDIVENIFCNPRAHMKRKNIKSQYVKS